MNILIVDDEPLARQRLQRMLSESKHQVIGEAQDGHQALEHIQRLSPDVVLLDIHMPDMTGLEVAAASRSMQNTPIFIFCTAHDEHALNAFRVQALDYLLKPVRQMDLLQALTRAEQQLRSASLEPAPEMAVIQAKTRKGLLRVPIKDVMLFQADQKYVSLVYSEGELVIDEPLKELEARLAPAFLRVHRSFLVNTAFIEGVERTDSGHNVLLKGLEAPIPVSRRHWSALKDWLQQHH